MGGQISVDSKLGSGTTFSFELSLPVGSKEKIAEQLSSAQMDGSILNGLKILLVDDNADNRVVARDTLESKSAVEISEAGNGQEALDLLAVQDFDIVLMDVQMPVMDGYTATQQIRNHFPVPKKDIPVVALTASVIRSDLDKCRAAGMNDYVPKPYKASELITAIAKLTGREAKYKTIDQGPLTKEIEQSSMVHGLSSSFDLSYLEDFCEGDKDRMKKYINIVLETAPVFIDKLKEAIVANDTGEMASQLHGFRTKLIMMGMHEAKDLADQIELNCRKNMPETSQLMKDASRLIHVMKQAVDDLEKLSIG